jgi:16S rRNA (adenine1518-N6/adenine1519-N6)-dimethyltransferase
MHTRPPQVGPGKLKNTIKYRDSHSQVRPGHRAKKSLGQNFLKSEGALNSIIRAGNLKKGEIVLEIGPGKGALTKKLLESRSKVIAVEKDRELFTLLKETFKTEIKNKQLTLIEGDILEFVPNTYNLKSTSYKVVANIPYNITGLILRKFLEEESIKPKSIVLLIQKEVAERIVARDKKESILSISVKAYGDPIYIEKVSKRYFQPSPKVDSAIIAINNISNKKFEDKKIKEKDFFKVLHTGFAHKRKILKSNLKHLGKTDEQILKIFKNIDIKEKSRPEEINIEKWLRLAQEFNPQK